MKKTLTTLAVAAATIITTAGAAAAAPVFDIKPAALSRGADVQIAHIEGHSVVDGSIRIEVPAARVALLGKTGSSYVIQTHNADYRNAQVWRMRPDGSRTRLLHGRNAENVVLSDTGATLVSATGVSGSRTQLLASTSPQATCREPGSSGATCQFSTWAAGGSSSAAGTGHAP